MTTRHRFYPVTAGTQRCDRCNMAKTGGVTRVPPCDEGGAVCSQTPPHTPRWHMVVTRPGLPDSCAYCHLAGGETEWDTVVGPSGQL